MQSCIILQPVKSSQNVILQEFMRLIISNGERIVRNETWIVLGSIVKAGKVLTNGFTFPMKPLSNGGDLEKNGLPSNDPMVPMLYLNHESLCLPNEWEKSPWLTKELHQKSLQMTALYLSQRRGTIIMQENMSPYIVCDDVMFIAFERPQY